MAWHGRSFALLIGLVCLGFPGVLLAQPGIPKDRIPWYTRPDVRQEIERLYDSRVWERIHAIWVVENMGAKARPAVPFLIELLADEADYLPAVPRGVPRHIVVHGDAATALMKIGIPAKPGLAAAAREHSIIRVRLRAAAVLVRMGEKGAIEAVAAAATSADPDIRWQAVASLVEFKDPRAVPPLIALLSDASRQEAAVALLGEAGDPRATEALAALLPEAEPVRARAILSALGRIGKAPADLGPILALVSHGDEEVRWSAAANLARMQDRRALQPLLAALEDKHEGVRGAAATGLGLIGDKAAVLPLIRALQADPDGWVRSDAAKSLGQIGDPRAVEPLIGALEDKESHVRVLAAIALGELGGERALEALLAKQDDRYGYVMEAVFSALGRIGKPAVPALLQMAAEGKRAAIRTLGEGGHQEAVKPLMVLLKEERPHLDRELVIRSLGLLGDERALKPLGEVATRFTRYDCPEAIRALGRLDGPEAARMLLKILDEGGHLKVTAETLVTMESAGVATMAQILLREEPPAFRAGRSLAIKEVAALALAGQGEAGLKPLVDALSRGSREAKRAAADALARMGEMAVGPLAAALDHEDPDTRASAAGALGEAGFAVAEKLTRALGAPEPWVRLHAAGALGRLCEPRAIEPLVTLLEKDDLAYVREAAANALRTVTGRDFGKDAAKWRSWMQEHAGQRPAARREPRPPAGRPVLTGAA